MSLSCPAVSRGTRIASLCGLSLALFTSTAVGGLDTQPRLVDGSKAPRVPQVLAGYGNLRMTRVEVGTIRAERARLKGCPDIWRAGGKNLVVERVGYSGRTVTFLVSRTEIAGCDSSPRARPSYGPWCGSSGWTFRNGRVPVPRLDLCASPGGGTLVAAFAWINPVRRAKWIVVDQGRYQEVYPVAGGLPVRVSTRPRNGPGGTVFRTAQYDAHGVLLVRRKVVASIAS